MNIIKVILAILGTMLGIMAAFWLIGIVWSLLWYVFVFGIIGALGYGGYRLFRNAEDKYIGAGSADEIVGARDYNMSWEEYERKYLPK
ncbi:MAG: hypothetical protein WBD22_10375 [Pyrinomonadaceae bacterium]